MYSGYVSRMTLTEFNQNPSQATRLARVEDVTITDRGIPTFVLSLVIQQPTTKIDELRKAGLIQPARQTALPFPVLAISPDIAREMIADFEAGTDDPLA